MVGARSKMFRPTLSLAARIALALGALVVSAGVSLFAGASRETALGVAGFVFGVVTFVLSEVKEREGPTKNIWYIGQEDADFNDNIRRGLEEGLRRKLPHQLDPAAPGPTDTDVARWQQDLLGQGHQPAPHAVVILPATDDEALWTQLADLAERGVSVVVIDVEPRWETFFARGIEPPVYVSSDFVEGGRIAGELVAEALVEKPRAFGLVAVGPSSSSAGAGRSARILYALAQRGLLPRVRTVELAGWHTATASQALAEEIETMLAGVGAGSAEVVVFCGDDRIMSALSRTYNDHPGWQDHVWLVGYDGTTGTDGLFLAQHEQGRCIGSVDTDPRAQGRSAASALLESYAKPSAAVRRRWTVKPRALTPDSRG